MSSNLISRMLPWHPPISEAGLGIISLSFLSILLIFVSLQSFMKQCDSVCVRDREGDMKERKVNESKRGKT